MGTLIPGKYAAAGMTIAASRTRADTAMPAYTAKVAIRRVASAPPGKEEKSRPPNNGRLAGHSNPCTAPARPPHLLPVFRYTPLLRLT
jgi:hypothetical protein